MTLHPPEILGLIWGGSELCLALARRSKSNAVSKDGHSMGMIWVVRLLAIALGIIASFRLSAYAMPWPKQFFQVGCALFVLGLILRWYAIIYLGRFFTTNVAIAKDHSLIDSGPYRFIRHPSYTGDLLITLGFALIFTNWASLLIIFVPCCAAMLWRIRVEESVLLAALGEHYQNYMQRTKRLVPLIY